MGLGWEGGGGVGRWGEYRWGQKGKGVNVWKKMRCRKEVDVKEEKRGREMT